MEPIKKKNLFKINCVQEAVNKQKGRDKHISFNLVLDSLWQQPFREKAKNYLTEKGSDWSHVGKWIKSAKNRGD